MEAKQITGKNVFVTGCSKGIGLAIVKKFLGEGYTVYGCDLHEPDLDRKNNFVFLNCDISDHDQVKQLYHNFLEKNIKFHSIINNAGINLNASIEDISYEDWDRVLKTNVYGPFNVTRYMHLLLDTCSPSIVNIGSDQSFIAKKNRVAYCTSKGAILQFSRSLAVDLAHKGIRVNCVCPGPIDTPMARELIKDQAFEIKQPIPRLGKPEEVADVVFFLCSESAAYITGTSVMVDGGYTAM
ncbi:MAG: SDR family oxidoreductase [Clostridia bacterium]|nr:SDR family oxidoreductase [Clostridia bacterium]